MHVELAHNLFSCGCYNSTSPQFLSVVVMDVLCSDIQLAAVLLCGP
jgi:hypothetical protein